jgi:hypothetical protein
MRNLGVQTPWILTGKGFIALLAILLWCQNLPAQSPFYQGKTINIIVGYPAGTTHDIWAANDRPLYAEIPGGRAYFRRPTDAGGRLDGVGQLYL